MKEKIFRILPLMLVIGIVLVGATSCSDDDDEVITSVVNIEEEAGLVYMREEEKLARDVYIKLYEKWGLNMFDNISKSEQKHMDKLLTILDVNNILDPSLSDVGKFTNVELQNLYNSLMAKGVISLNDALIVGATIEDVDIVDLQKYIDEASDPIIISTYESLMCGSRNHMRAFISQLASNGGSYTPQFMTQEEYDEVINGSHESCN